MSPAAHARWAFLPVFGAHLAHAPVLSFDLFPELARPMDGGRTWRRRRVLGDNKTWRGAAAMFSGAFAATLALSQVPAYRARLPRELADAPAPFVGLLLSTGVVIGELPNSFLTRQLGIAPGGRHGSRAGIALALFDQADFVPITSLLLRPLYRMSVREVLEAAVLVTAIHLPVNVVGYAIGARTSPI